MKLLLALFVTFNCLLIAANNDVPGWQSEYGKTRSFIENKGQFDKRLKTNSPILFAHDGGDHNYFFTKEGVVFELSHKEKRDRTDAETEVRKVRKASGFENHKEWQKFQEADFRNRVVETRDELRAIWLGSNPDVQIIAEEKDNFYHSYNFFNSVNELVNVNEIASYKKIIYKNLYPNIDVVYEFHPEIGIKYSVVLHPGADPSVVKLRYSKDIQLLPDGTIKTKTALGDIIDHAPITFYEGNESDVILSKYHIEYNTISFQLSDYDNSRTIVIDPWTQTPNFNTNWKCVWECERDGAGNVYIIGGVMPLQLLKYSPAGALQWTYNTPYDTTMWLGTFATDLAGNSYVSNGSTARIQKINTAGGLTWNNPNPGGLFSSTEFWNITFNCDQTRLVIGGTGGFIPPVPYIYEMDMNNGNVVSSVQIHNSGGVNPQEIRALAPSNNGRYYFLTHDTIGYIHNNLNACGAAGATKVLFDSGLNFDYKCENYRYDNSGIMALAYYDGHIYVNRGNQLQKRDFYTSNIVGTVAIPGGVFNTQTIPFLGTISKVGNSGIDIDDCGNIYVGSGNGVYKFDQNLNQITSFPTTYNVYDVQVSLNGDVIACGSTGTSSSNPRTGTIQSFAANACTPTAIECCDVALCPVDDLCVYDAPFSITPIGTPGGTWSGTGVNASGVFDPALAGVGSHSITYTLPCGFETITIVVNECPQLEICIDENGDLVASGGNGNYNWATGVVGPTSYPINNEQQCIDCPSTTPNYFAGFYTGCSSSTCNTTDTTWTPVATGNTYTPTTYPLLIVDGNGTFIILENATGLADCEPTVACPTITVAIQNQTNVSCFGDFSGSATVNASGGNGPYNYIWTPGNLNGPIQSNLSAQTYTVNVTDSDGCPGTVQVNITQPTPLSSTTSSTEACNGNDGSATINVSGGTGSYTYDWNPNVGNTATVNGLSVGDYEVTVTDQNGCTMIETISVTCNIVPCPTITVSITNQTNVLCFGGNTGTATVSASGGNGPYTYSWSPGGLNGATQNSLSAQTYTVNVIDNDGCPGTVQVTINQPTQLSATTSSVEASCGGSDGSATVNASGGTGSYTYTWSPNVGNTATVNNIPAGSYQVTVTDANNCQIQQNILVSNQNAPSVSILSTTDESCVGAADGEATVSASGGSGNYTYSWSPSGGNAATASNLSSGNYTVTVTDDAGCETSIVVTINSASAIIIDASITDEDCGMMNGELITSVSGGSGNYSYSWSNGEITSSINGLQTGEYTVVVTDDTGCSASETFTVGVIGTLDVTVTPTSATIEAGESIQLEASGGFTYSWSPATGLSCTDCPDPTASPINSTTYTVTAVDENGCAGEATVYIFVQALCGELFIPTIFSPNSDGLNDKHCILGGCITEFELIIYNRWGERVFVSRDQANCWDGFFRGEKVQSGVYVYKIKVTLVDGTQITDSGNINVVR